VESQLALPLCHPNIFTLWFSLFVRIKLDVIWSLLTSLLVPLVLSFNKVPFIQNLPACCVPLDPNQVF